METTSLVSNKAYNYPAVVVVWIILFFFLLTLAHMAGCNGKVWTFVILLVSAVATFGDNEYVEVMTHKQLLIFGQETDIWVGPGLYFLLFVFSFAKGEDIHEEKKDILIQKINCHDKNGKALLGEINGDWIATDANLYKSFDAKTMSQSLEVLLKRTFIRICGKLPYRSTASNDVKQILGERLGPKLFEDESFNSECKKYGIRFTNIVSDAIASDLKQENLNAYREELYNKEAAKYGRHHLSKEDIRKINQDVDVALGKAQRIISNAPILPRVDMNNH